MKFKRHLFGFYLGLSLLGSSLNAQQQSASAPIIATVPRLVNFSGKTTDVQGKPIAGIAGVTFAIYKDQYEGAPLWLETQNIQADSKGNYTVQLGATKPEGLPLDLFSSGDARWLGVTVNGGQEQPRVLLLSVPYALKAADAETIGGLPPSAFMLAAPPASSTSSSAARPASSPSAASALPPNPAVTGAGAASFMPLWDSSSDIVNSVLFQSGSGATAKVGINTTTPASTLDVKGSETVRGNLSLPATATASATAGKNSQPTTFTASAFNSGTGAAVNQNFRWQAEPVGNNTASTSGTLNLLYAAGSNPLAETGLRVGGTGHITFATGQTFPGTVTSVGLSAPSSDFSVSGSPVTANGTIGLNWNVPPTSVNAANAIVKRDAAGNFNATTITATGQLIAQATVGNGNAVLASSSNPVATVIYGGANSSTGATWGVEGEQFSSDPGASGVVGRAHNGGVGVTGLSDLAAHIGVYGQFGSQSLTGLLFSNPSGVWGDGGTATFVAPIGVLGTVDDGYAGTFVNNSPRHLTTLAAYAYDSATYPFFALNAATGGYCDVDPSGNLSCSGTKNAVVPLDGGKRKVAMSAIESPENWFEDAGSAQLIGGVAVVPLDPDFIQTVNTKKEYRVFPVPNGDCRGLYVTNKSANSFEVRELGGGISNVRFDYRIMAIRRKYETVRFADHTNDPDPRKMMEQMRKVRPASSSDPASVKPASPSLLGAQVTKK
jgi:hypothetical protein